MLEGIYFDNFLSFKKATLENLQPVNLLIGPNNVGKSNLLKALEFVFQHFEKPVSPIVLDGFSFKHSSPNFHVELIHSSSETIEESYSLDWNLYDVPLPSLKVSKLEINIRTRKFNRMPNIQQLSDLLANLKIHKPDSNKLTKPFPLLPNNDSVSADADNLVAFLDIIQGKYRDSFDAIEKDLQRCIPEFSRIQLDNVEATDELKKIYGDKTFKRLGLYNFKQKITYWADELSEGTLYFLALLCIVHQPNPPKLLLLEEPEKGIHPRRIKEVIDFIFQLSNEKGIQVIMTSHHPYVINEFKDLPEAIYIFDKDEEGATQIKNLQKDVIEPSDRENKEKGLPAIKFTEDLADHWILGFMGGVPK